MSCNLGIIFIENFLKWREEEIMTLKDELEDMT